MGLGEGLCPVLVGSLGSVRPPSPLGLDAEVVGSRVFSSESLASPKPSAPSRVLASPQVSMAQPNLLLMWELLLPLVSPTAQTLSGSEAGQRPALCQSFLRCRMRCSLQVQKPNPPLQVGLRLPQTQRMAQAGNVKEEERCRQVLGS